MPAHHASSVVVANHPEGMHSLAACPNQSCPHDVAKLRYLLPSPPRWLLLQLHVIREGAADPRALLGCIRQVHWLAQQQQLGSRRCRLVVDCGTGVTATGKPACLTLRSTACLSGFAGKQRGHQRAAVLPERTTERTAAAKQQPCRPAATGPSSDPSALEPHSMPGPIKLDPVLLCRPGSGSRAAAAALESCCSHASWQ